MTYVIKKTYLPVWGRESEGNPIVSIDEIKKFAEANSMDVDDVMCQFIFDTPFYGCPKGEPGNDGLDYKEHMKRPL